MTTKETSTLETGVTYTDPNGQQVGLGGLTDDQVYQQITEKENMLSQVTSQYNQRERTAIYQSLEALRTEAARRLEDQKKVIEAA